MRRHFDAVTAALALALLAGCGSSSGDSARVGGLLVAPPPPAGTPDPSMSSLAISPATGLTANGTDTATITVTILDSTGQPLGNQSVVLTASGAGAAVNPSSGITNGLGQFTALLTSTSPGTISVSALVNPGLGQILLGQSPTATFDQTPAGTPNPNQTTLIASPTSGLNANGTDSSNLTVTVRDAMGNPLANQTVQFSATGGGTSFSTTTAMSNASGVVTSSVTATQPGPKTIRATVNPGANSVLSASQPVIIFSAAPGSPDPSQSTLSASPLSGISADGVSASTVTVTVRDPSGAVLGGQTVQLSVAGGATLTPTSGTTNGAGQITAMLTATQPGPKTISGIVNPGASQVNLAQTPIVTFSAANPPNPDRSTIALSATSGVLANGVDMINVTVTVRDLNNVPLPNQAVAISAAGGGTTFSPAMGTSSSTGEFTTALSATTAGNKTITVTVNPTGNAVTLTNQPIVIFDQPVPVAAQSSVTANPTTGVTANGTAASTVTVTVRDASGVAIPGVTVTLSSSGMGTSLSPATGATNASGVLTSQLTSTMAGATTVTAVAGGVTLSPTPTVTFVTGGPGAPSAAMSTVSANPTTNVPADGATASTITVTVRDASGTLIPNTTVNLSATNGATLTPATGMTNASGVLTSQLTSTTVGSSTVTAIADPAGANVTITQTAQVAFVMPSGSTINGTANNDNLTGTAANDTINGLGGNDVLEGLAGADTLNGGPGTDTASYSMSPAGVTVNLGANSATGGDAAGDTFTDIENLTGSPQDDTLTGDGGDNVLNGLAGNDTLNGGDGADTLIGGPGADSLNGGTNTAMFPDFASYAGSAAVSIDLGAGTATGGDAAGDTFTGVEGLIGTDNADTLIGNNTANVLMGGAADDILNGAGGDDVLDGGPGADTLDGGADNDTATYVNDSTGIMIDLAQGTFAGGEAAGDSLVNIENLVGGIASDDLFGDTNDNVLMGNAGNDRLIPNNLTGQGGGADVMQGNDDLDLLFYVDDQAASLDGGGGVDAALLFVSADFSNAAVRGKFSNIEDYTTVDSVTIVINSSDVSALGQPFTLGGTPVSAIFLYDVSNGGVGLPSPISGTGWTFLGTISNFQRLLGAARNYNVFQDASVTPPATIFVDQGYTNVSLTP